MQGSAASEAPTGGDRLLRERIVARLRDTAPSATADDWRVAGARVAQRQRLRPYFPAHPVPAAVLVPIVDHRSGLTMLLTQRADALKNHAGQVSFPGGRIESTDSGPIAAALRETREEIGLDARHVHVLGYLPDHLIVSGYRVTPVVAFVDPGSPLELAADEVRSTFELPLSYAFDTRNHHVRLRRIGDQDIEVYEIPFGPNRIWGATAGMLMTLHELVTSGPQ